MRNISALAVTAMLSCTNFDCTTLSVKTRPLVGSKRRKVSVLYAFKIPIASFYPDLKSVVLKTNGINPAGIITSVLNRIPGVTITNTEKEMVLNGEPWDGKKQSIFLP